MKKELIDKLIREIPDKGELRDLYKIAKGANILVIEEDLGRDGGFYFYEAKTKTIIINIKLSYYHRLIVLAHEIAHAILHPYEEAYFTCIGFPKASIKENEANYFACKLLDFIGFWSDENLCIYEHELNKSDKGFIAMYMKYLSEPTTKIYTKELI